MEYYKTFHVDVHRLSLRNMLGLGIEVSLPHMYEALALCTILCPKEK